MSWLCCYLSFCYSSCLLLFVLSHQLSSGSFFPCCPFVSALLSEFMVVSLGFVVGFASGCRSGLLSFLVSGLLACSFSQPSLPFSSSFLFRPLHSDPFFSFFLTQRQSGKGPGRRSRHSTEGCKHKTNKLWLTSVLPILLSLFLSVPSFPSFRIQIVKEAHSN